jgi:hypothetical protein
LGGGGFAYSLLDTRLPKLDDLHALAWPPRAESFAAAYSMFEGAALPRNAA